MAFPEDSEEIPPMSVTQFELVAKDMAAERAPTPPRDLCDLDTEEVDGLLESAPALVKRLEKAEEMEAAEEEAREEVEARGDVEATEAAVENKRSGSLGSLKRGSSGGLGV